MLWTDSSELALIWLAWLWCSEDFCESLLILNFCKVQSCTDWPQSEQLNRQIFRRQSHPIINVGTIKLSQSKTSRILCFSDTSYTDNERLEMIHFLRYLKWFFFEGLWSPPRIKGKWFQLRIMLVVHDTCSLGIYSIDFNRVCQSVPAWPNCHLYLYSRSILPSHGNIALRITLKP